MMVTGEIFLFNKENYFGVYSSPIMSVVYQSLKKQRFTGKINCYSGDSIVSGYREYCIGVLLYPRKSYEKFWSLVEEDIKSNPVKNVEYRYMEVTSKRALINAYFLSNGTFMLENGIATDLLDSDSIQSKAFMEQIINDSEVSEELRIHLEPLWEKPIL